MNSFLRFIICNVVFDVLLYTYFFIGWPDDGLLESVQQHTKIAIAGALLQCLIIALALLKKDWRAAICTDRTKLKLVRAYFILSFAGAIIIGYTYFVETFTVGIGSVNFGVRN